MSLQIIDLNCDLGEGMDTDAAIMPFISSANIACGYHAGDADTMRRTVVLCLQHNVAVGAHPSFPDREHFGRLEMDMPPGEVILHVLEQLEMMHAICNELGTVMHHVKPHGALYNMSARQPELAAAIAEAVARFDPALKLFGLAGSCSIRAAQDAGLATVDEFFADRTYQPDGTLTPRSHANALIESDADAVAQALLIAGQRQVKASNGHLLQYHHAAAASICLHGDGAHALSFARHIHQALSDGGFLIRAT